MAAWGWRPQRDQQRLTYIAEGVKPVMVSASARWGKSRQHLAGPHKWSTWGCSCGEGQGGQLRWKAQMRALALAGWPVQEAS